MSFNINNAFGSDLPVSFKCSYCSGHSVLNKTNSAQDFKVFRLDGQKYRDIRSILSMAICVNSECGEITLGLCLEHGDYYPSSDGWKVEEKIQEWTILPESSAQPQPDYIPAPIRKSYTEACRIKELSPTASATLSRRCLQAMIHDFWGINKGNLYKEIEALPDEVSPETLAAIHAVRQIGNIGAHMKFDTDTLVDVDVDEAAAMIDLIELLFDGWYIARYNRAEKLRRMTEAIAKRAGRYDGNDGETDTDGTEPAD